MNAWRSDVEASERPGAPVGWSNTRLYLCGQGGIEAVRASGHVWRDQAGARPVAGGQARRRLGVRSADYEQHRAANLRKAAGRARRYVKVNGLRYLWSLTFQANESDVGVADRAFWKFSRWLGAQGVLWLAVREFQKRGAVHYHLAVDRFLSHTALAAAWGQGYVFVTGPAHGGKPGAAAGYLTKYLVKEIDDKRFVGRHSYLRCAGLAVWEVEDTFTRSEEEFIELMAGLAELYGWATSYCRRGGEFQTYGAGPP